MKTVGHTPFWRRAWSTLFPLLAAWLLFWGSWALFHEPAPRQQATNATPTAFIADRNIGEVKHKGSGEVHKASVTNTNPPRFTLAKQYGGERLYATFIDNKWVDAERCREIPSPTPPLPPPSTACEKVNLNDDERFMFTVARLNDLFNPPIGGPRQ